jgi:hypothetical protein
MKIFHVFFIICLINIYLLKIWIFNSFIYDMNMDECDILNEWSLFTNSLVFTWFCNGKLSIKVGKCCLPNLVNILMRFRIRDNHCVFVFENIWIRIRIRVKMWYKSDSMRIPMYAIHGNGKLSSAIFSFQWSSRSSNGLRFAYVWVRVRLCSARVVPWGAVVYLFLPLLPLASRPAYCVWSLWCLGVSWG